MRDIEDSHSKLSVQLGKQAEDFRLGDDVQSTGGLIGNEERRSVEDGHGDDDALGLAYAQLGRPATQKIAVVRETDIRERRADCSSAFAARSARVSARDFTEWRADTQNRGEGGQRTLQNDAHFTAA